MTISVPSHAIKLADRERSKWNLLITQFKYTSIPSSKSSSKSKKVWRRGEESNPHPFGASVFETGGRPFRPAPPQLGANLAGDQGFEPCRNGFGVRRSSSRVMSPVVPDLGSQAAIPIRLVW